MTAVLLLAFGGPDDMDSIEPFLKNVLPGRPVTPELVERVKSRYALIGGKSPLPEITWKQAKLLEERLNKSLPGTVPILRHDEAVSVNRDSPLFKVYVGMRHWHPFIKDTVRQIKCDGISRIIAVPMAPQASKASTGGYIDALNKALEEFSGLDVKVVESWYKNPLYLQAVADTLKEALKELPEERRKYLHVIFSAHSLPIRTVEGDPYEVQLQETMQGIVQITGPLSHCLAYQSKGQASGEWLGPEVEAVMESLAKEGKKDIIIVPIGFVCDHVETLYDIDIVFKKKAEELGMNFNRAASLNYSPLFIEALADIVKTSL